MKCIKILFPYEMWKHEIPEEESVSARRWPQARLTRRIGENRRKLGDKSIYRRVPVRVAEFTVGDVEGYDVQNSGSACLDLAETC